MAFLYTLIKNYNSNLFFFNKNFFYLNWFFLFYFYFKSNFNIIFLNKKLNKNFYYFKLFFKNYFLNKKYKNLTINKEFILYLSFYYSVLFKISINILSLNLTTLFNDLILYKVLIKNNFRRFKFLNVKYTYEIFELVFISLYFKTLKAFSFWLKYYLESIHFKKHKFVLKLIYKLLFKYFKKQFIFINVKGLQFLMRGKIGKGGNSKKSKIFYYFGKGAKNNKTLKMTYYYQQVRTDTGVVNFFLSLFY